MKQDELVQRNKKTREQRIGFLATLSDHDLNRPIRAQPEKDRTINFPLGQTIVEVCNHSAHHRSNAINMLRQVGITAPPTDYALMKRETTAPQMPAAR